MPKNKLNMLIQNIKIISNIALGRHGHHLELLQPPTTLFCSSQHPAWLQQLACWLDFGCHSRDPELPPLVLASIFELVAAVMVSPDLPLPAWAASLTLRCPRERRDVGLMLEEETVVHLTPLVFFPFFLTFSLEEAATYAGITCRLQSSNNRINVT
jgi:hypothetical protein